MVFAIIKTGGKQYKVKVGDIIKVEKLEAEKSVILDDILFDKKVTADILSKGRHSKVRILKFKAKKRYRRIKGHRQAYTELKIISIK